MIMMRELYCHLQVSVFRWGIGSDQNSQSSGKLAFAFSNSEGVHDIYDSGLTRLKMINGMISKFF